MSLAWPLSGEQFITVPSPTSRESDIALVSGQIYNFALLLLFAPIIPNLFSSLQNISYTLSNLQARVLSTRQPLYRLLMASITLQAPTEPMSHALRNLLYSCRPHLQRMHSRLLQLSATLPPERRAGLRVRRLNHLLKLRRIMAGALCADGSPSRELEAALAATEAKVPRDDRLSNTTKRELERWKQDVLRKLDEARWVGLPRDRVKRAATRGSLVEKGRAAGGSTENAKQTVGREEEHLLVFEPEEVRKDANEDLLVFGPDEVGNIEEDLVIWDTAEGVEDDAQMDIGVVNTWEDCTR